MTELIDLALAAVTSPGAARSALPAAEATLRSEDALVTIAAACYSSPGLPSALTAGAVISLLRSAGLPAQTYRLAGEVLSLLLTTPAGRHAPEKIAGMLREKGRPPAVYQVLVDCLRYAAWWTPDLLNPDPLIALLGLPHLRDLRRALAEDVIERLLYRAGKNLAVSTFEQFAQACGNDPGFKYVCTYLAARRDMPAEVREKARQPYELHRKIQAALGRDTRRVLIVQNINDGQGDEIVRCVPLMQALLDFNEELEIVLVSGRTYLYAHPRVTLVPIRDRARVEALFRESFDAVIDFFEPGVPRVNHDPELEPVLQACRPRLFLSSTKGHNRFVFERLEFDAAPLAQTLGLDKQRVANTYETTFRLTAELGLPLRCGEDSPASEPVLAGITAPHAEAEWQVLTGGNASARPVAILNPFGGLDRLKGYTDRTLGSLALEIRRLVQEGYYVVLLPNGTAWSAPDLLHQALASVPAAEHAHIVVGPDPSGKAEDRDHVMHLFTYFVRYADLIVAAEGWMIHAAYCLGKPYRILMLPYSHDAAWHPYVQTRRQGVDAEGVLEFDEGATPPQPRKFALLFVLREIGGRAGERAVPLLRWALKSEDRDVRLAAVQSMAKLRSHDTDPDLITLLDDPAYRVRAAAAAALLDRRAANGSGPLRRETLKAYVCIGQQPSDWFSAARLENAARPALEAALDDDDPVIRRESAQILRLLDLKAKHQPQRANLLRPRNGSKSGETVLILTPVKDASGSIGRYCRRVSHLTYPHSRISLGFLESDSVDGTFEDLQRHIPALSAQFRRVGLWKKDFDYRVPPGLHRGAEAIQAERRTILARSRNHLLFHALDDEDWVLWLDVDVIEYPCDIVERLLAAGRDIVQPHCVLDYGGATFDRNAWRDQGKLHVDDLRPEGELVEIDAVGGTMLLVRADLHRDGLVFPAFPYGEPNPLIRSGRGERETEGLGIMAHDMGHRCWAMPHLEIRHRRW